MYLSRLMLDAADRRGRSWLSNPYRIHQRMMKAFPDGEAGRALFRLEDDWLPPRIIAQTSGRADWDAAFDDFPILRRWEQKELPLSFLSDQRLRFFLRSNPTKKVAAMTKEGEREDRSVRLGLLKEDDQRQWLMRKGDAGGFRPLNFQVRSSGMQISFRERGEKPQTHFRVDFEGTLRVTDPERFLKTLQEGVGSAKGFGFGLLSVAPGG